MRVTSSNKALYRYAVFTAFCTLLLVCVGGMVTSKGVGMAVPDWPTSYGYNMFLFPVSKWIGGIFWEHLHRLAASGIGTLSIGLAVWIWLKDGRSWVKKLGLLAVGLVIFQGILGGLRVVLDKSALLDTTFGTIYGLAHACTGQSFFVLLCLIALVLSPAWGELDRAPKLDESADASVRFLFRAGTCLVFLQLVLGASMRHQHAGLAVPDFPLAYGQVWPATDADSLLRYNQHRMDETTVTAFQIWLHMLHRINACLTAVVIVWAAIAAWRNLGRGHRLTQLALVWVGMVACQWALGMTTVLKNKPADIATAHVAVGALTLALGGLLLAINAKLRLPVAERNLARPVAAPSGWAVRPG